MNIILIPIGGQNAAAFTTLISQATSFAYCYFYGKRYVNITGMTSVTIKSLIGCAAVILIGMILKRMIINICVQTTLVVILSVLLYAIIEIALKNKSVIAIVRNVKLKLVHK